MPSQINPYAAPRSDPSTPPRGPVQQSSRRWNFAVGCAVVVLIGSPVAASFAVFDIESIVISGPILLLVAIALGLLSKRQDLQKLLSISLVMIAMVIGCFLTIFLNDWSPPRAQYPIGVATAIYAIVIQLGWVLVRSIWIERKNEMHASESTVPRTQVG